MNYTELQKANDLLGEINIFATLSLGTNTFQ